MSRRTKLRDPARRPRIDAIRNRERRPSRRGRESRRPWVASYDPGWRSRYRTSRSTFAVLRCPGRQPAKPSRTDAAAVTDPGCSRRNSRRPSAGQSAKRCRTITGSAPTPDVSAAVGGRPEPCRWKRLGRCVEHAPTPPKPSGKTRMPGRRRKPDDHGGQDRGVAADESAHSNTPSEPGHSRRAGPRSSQRRQLNGHSPRMRAAFHQLHDDVLPVVLVQLLRREVAAVHLVSAGRSARNRQVAHGDRRLQVGPPGKRRLAGRPTRLLYFPRCICFQNGIVGSLARQRLHNNQDPAAGQRQRTVRGYQPA